MGWTHFAMGGFFLHKKSLSMIILEVYVDSISPRKGKCQLPIFIYLHGPGTRRDLPSAHEDRNGARPYPPKYLRSRLRPAYHAGDWRVLAEFLACYWSRRTRASPYA